MGGKCDIGLIGLAVMGQNLALNIESAGYQVAVYNRTTTTTEEFIKKRASNKNINPAYSLEEFVSLLQVPRKIILMVKAGAPVDYVIEGLLPYLEEGDIIIDGGNSYYRDTERRVRGLKERGIRFLGTGISGGEYGALHGPSIMPGGDESAYREVEEIFSKIAARAEDGPCVSYLGECSAGHYVKMVHNGIEYGVMELIAESYDLMRKTLGLSPAEMGGIFREWNEEQQSYLLEITGEIMDREDQETGKPLIDLISDVANQKGTGKWTAQEALDLGVPVPVITAAVNARYLSSYKEERGEFSRLFPAPERKTADRDFLVALEEALYLATVTAYAEGMDLLKRASSEYGYNLPLAEVARIWQDGCIIRSNLLKQIQRIYKEAGETASIILSDEFSSDFAGKIENLRRVVSLAAVEGIPVPAFSAALAYFDSLSARDLPANLIQAQRDYFGAHTYQRKDKEGTFHTDWQDIKNV